MADKVTNDIFDMNLRSLRRDRAFRTGPELFLHDRAFGDCLERLELVRRPFGSALLLGCPDPHWPDRLAQYAQSVEVADPGSLHSRAAGGKPITEDEWDPAPEAYDLVLAIGSLDTVNDLPRALRSLHTALKPDSLLMGVIAGGESLPQLRRAMHLADQASGVSTPHIHPRIEAASLSALLTACGFVMPVVDIDRVEVSYSSLDRLVSDLRRMGATNILKLRSRSPLSRTSKAQAEAAFRNSGDGSRTLELFELLHFAAWTPPR